MIMQKNELGRTGLKASVLGLGGGGYSRLGMRESEEEAVRVVRRALDLGVNLFDTAEGYGTEPIFGRALRGTDRSQIILCSKASARHHSPESFRRCLEDSLRKLATDYIDVYQFHGLRAEDYDDAVQRLLPVLRQAREEGKIRFLGLTEAFEADTAHTMLQRALQDDGWDTVMVGCNILNFSASRTVFPVTLGKGIGVLGMFAVRHALANPENLALHLRALAAQGEIHPDASDADGLVRLLLAECDSLPEAAYRFCRHLPGLDVVLSGTGSVEHLEANVRAVNKPPLSEAALAHLRRIFGTVQSVSGKAPERPC